MHVDFITPEEKLFEGDATSVILPGVGGYFEILDRHAPLIAALGKGQTKITTAQGTKTYTITGSFAEVLNNKLVVLAESAKSGDA